MIFFIILLSISFTYQVLIGSKCSSNSPYCGTNQTIERLICDNNECKGMYGYNYCSDTRKCATGLFCTSNNICDYCMPGCDQCTSKEICTKCGNEYYLGNDGLCYLIAYNCIKNDGKTCKECADYYYLDTNNKNCVSCPLNCKKCNSYDSCTLCDNGNYWNSTAQLCLPGMSNCKISIDNNTCSECQAGYYLYINLTQTCIKGPDSCQEVYPPGYCKACDVIDINGYSGTNSYLLDSNSNYCVKMTVEGCIQGTISKCTKCSAGRYLSYDGLTCTKKIYGCVLAETDISCSICDIGFRKQKNSVTGAYECSDCPVGCELCANGPCTKCLSGYYLDQSTKTCFQAAIGCARSLSETECESCLATYRLEDKECKICGFPQGPLSCGCEKGKFWTGEDCENCFTGCEICEDADICTKCLLNYYLDLNGECQQTPIPHCSLTLPLGICKTCLVGNYYDNLLNSCNKCTEIHSNCTQCTSKTQCTQCTTGNFLSNNTCNECKISNCGACSSNDLCDQCKIGYYWNETNLACNSCGEGCDICGKQNICSLCKSGYYLELNSTSCKKCENGCSKCNSENMTNCYDCFPGYFYKSEEMKCEICHGLCTRCTGNTKDNCTECIKNALLVNNTCSCIEGYMFDMLNRNCTLLPAISHGNWINQMNIFGILLILVMVIY